MARAPHSHDTSGSTPAVPSWAADRVDADGAPPRARHARLRAALQALLDARAPAITKQRTTSGSSWPDSFFDVDPGHEP